MNVKDWQGNTSVHQAIVSNVPTDICRVLFAKSSEDVFADEEFKRLYLVRQTNHACTLLINVHGIINLLKIMKEFDSVCRIML